MPSYGYLMQATGLGLARINFMTPDGTGHAQCELAYQNQVGPITDPSVSASVIRSFWAADIMPHLSIDVSLTTVEVTEWDSVAITQFTSVGANVPGGVSSDPVSPQVAILVRKNSGGIGKVNRGRFYLPGLPTDELVTPATLDPSYVTALQTAFTSFLSSTTGDSIVPMLITKTSDPAKYHHVQILAFVVEQQVATQRRRNRKAAHR